MSKECISEVEFPSDLRLSLAADFGTRRRAFASVRSSQGVEADDQRMRKVREGKFTFVGSILPGRNLECRTLRAAMPQSKQHHYYLPEFYLEFFAPMACSGLRSGAEGIQATDLLAKIEGATKPLILKIEQHHDLTDDEKESWLDLFLFSDGESLGF